MRHGSDDAVSSHVLVLPEAIRFPEKDGVVQHRIGMGVLSVEWILIRFGKGIFCHFLVLLLGIGGLAVWAYLVYVSWGRPAK